MVIDAYDEDWDPRQKHDDYSEGVQNDITGHPVKHHESKKHSGGSQPRDGFLEIFLDLKIELLICKRLKDLTNLHDATY